jgi:hypothetical protein
MALIAPGSFSATVLSCPPICDPKRNRNPITRPATIRIAGVRLQRAGIGEYRAIKSANARNSTATRTAANTSRRTSDILHRK